MAESLALRYAERIRPIMDVVCICKKSYYLHRGLLTMFSFCNSTYRMRCYVGANPRLVEGVHGGIRSVKHPVQLQDVAIGIGAAELISCALPD